MTGSADKSFRRNRCLAAAGKFLEQLRCVSDAGRQCKAFASAELDVVVGTASAGMEGLPCRHGGEGGVVLVLSRRLHAC